MTGLQLSAQAPSLVVIRYSATEVYKYFEGAVAKPILSLQDDIIDDLTSEVTVRDLGLLVRAPLAIIATVPFVLSAGVWLFMTKVFFSPLNPNVKHYPSLLQTKNYHCDKTALAKHYQDEIVTKFLNDLATEGSKNLKSALAQSSTAAKATVEFALQREDARYERESKEKDKTPSHEEVAELVASHLNFVAAEGTFLYLTKQLMKFVK
jgi:hypothetical protein